MRKSAHALLSLMALMGTAIVPQAALAQAQPAPAPPAEPPPAAAAPAEPAAPAAPAEPAPPPAPEPPPPPPAAPADTAAAAAAPAAPAAEEETWPAGWFRIDHDNLGLQLWVGATHDIGFNLATDIYVTDFLDTPFAEFDIGPAFAFGDLSLTPMAGIGFNWTEQKAWTLIAPQLFTIYNGDPIYFESWIQGFFYSPFTDGALDYIYSRDFVLFKVSDQFALGPTMDLTYNLGDDSKLASLWVGGAVMVNYGKNNTLLLALGYETQEDARTIIVTPGDPLATPPTADETEERGLRGRFTFIRTW